MTRRGDASCGAGISSSRKPWPLSDSSFMLSHTPQERQAQQRPVGRALRLEAGGRVFGEQPALVDFGQAPGGGLPYGRLIDRLSNAPRRIILGLELVDRWPCLLALLLVGT